MVKQKLKSSLQNERGMALVMVLVVSTALALVGGAYLSTSAQEAGLVTEQVQEVQALYAAESGVEYARRRLITWSEWASDWPESTINTGAGVTATVNFNSTTKTITSSSTIDGHTKQISLTVTPVMDDPFDQGACGCGSVNLSNNASTGSYTYDGVDYTSGSEGDVASNGNLDLAKAFVGGNVITGGYLSGESGTGGCKVTGTATAKTGFDSTLTTGAGGNIEGGIATDSNLEDPCDCDAINLTSLQTNLAGTNNNGNIDSSYLSGPYNTKLSIPTNVTLSGGTYYFTSFSVANNVTITIDATDANPVIIFFAKLYPDEAGTPVPVDDNTFDFNNNMVFNTNDKTNQLKIYSDISTTIEMDNNATFCGSIYAPTATINMKQNVKVYGAVLGGTTNMLNNSELHYDSNLSDVPLPGQVPPTEVGVQTSSWSQN